MFRLFHSEADYRFIDHGRVACPVRAADVDLDRCGECSWMRGIDRHAGLAVVRCRPKLVRSVPLEPFIGM
jgi:hypothetical protein